MTAPAPWVDPEVPAAGAALRERGLAAPPLESSPVEDSRRAYDRIGDFLCEGSQPLAGESEVQVPGPHGPIRCRVYRPEGANGPVPAVVYFHGGGFALGHVEQWQGLMRDLVRQSGLAAVNVEYRLSPEHRFPVQYEEAVAAIRHFAADGSRHGVDGTRLAAGGDSAGANLALAAACALRDAGGSPLRALLLYYGVFTWADDTDSWQRLGSGAFGLSLAQLEWIRSHYLAADAQRTDWRAAPGLAKLEGLPPVLLHAASLDPLLDDSRALQQRLQAAAVPVKLTVHEGVPHGFIRSSRLLSAARRAVADGAAALGAALASCDA
ncbi:MAG TPA: alpha/beta hydrolase fold domain-containing protein [Ramlibacter sp.]|nr:alpha/beta hydrolase fold domain-containing protein [Ramlibacter sp.]